MPVFKDGEAQIVKRFEDPDFWIRHDLWVETESDLDKDDRPDRVHVAVTRPRQTDTEGLKLPVVYVTSPYFAGTAPDAQDTMWSPRQELGEEPPKRTKSNQIERKGERLLSQRVMQKLGCLADISWCIPLRRGRGFHKDALQLGE